MLTKAGAMLPHGSKSTISSTMTFNCNPKGGLREEPFTGLDQDAEHEHSHLASPLLYEASCISQSHRVAPTFSVARPAVEEGIARV